VTTVPPCRALGRQCRELALTVSIAETGDPAYERDAVATWLLGHRERITFGELYEAHDMIVVDIRLHVPCKHLQDTDADDPAAVQCRAHGYEGRVPHRRQTTVPALRTGQHRFAIVEHGRLRPVDLAIPVPHRRALPVLAGSNPCATAPCRTADHTRGAACCRDLTLDVVLPLGEDRLEALLAARRPPYACKVKRTDEVTVECEVISACDYLENDGIHCGLHGLKRPDGHEAKPGICFDFPDLSDEELVGHPGCVFLGGRPVDG